MKREKLAVSVQAVWLSYLLTVGALGAMVTGLRLNVEHPGRLAALWAAVCLLAALLSNLRFGGWVLLAGAVGSALYLLRNEQGFAQTMDMLCKITNYYNNAYGWGFLPAPNMGAGPMDAPLAVLGAWIAMANCRCMCREKTGLAPLLLSALPLTACVVVTDTVPKPLYLYLWLLALVLILLSRGVRREQRRWGVNVVRLALLPTALALGLLFWAVPQAGYDKHPDELQEQVVQWIQELPDRWEEISGEVAEKLDGTIQPDAVNLRNTGPRIQRTYPVMEVTAPVSGTVYLRGQHYDTYTGTGWTVTEGMVPFSCPEDSRELGRITITTRTVREVLYLPYYPDENLNLFDGHIENTPRQKHDSYIMRGLDSQWRHTVAVMEASNIPLFQRKDAQRVNLELPEDTYAWAAEKAEAILHGENTATAVADAIAKYVRSSARYDLDTPRMSREDTDFAQWFLEESDTGYCVHFATAAVVLLRAAGVEARYVEGYMFTTHMGQETTVTADQAHAWAEYYEPLLDAWIVLEATPADLSGQPETEESEAPRPTQTEELLPTPTETEPQIPEREETQGTQDISGEPPGEKPLELGWLWKVLWWVLIPALAVLAVLVQRQLRLAWRERRRRKGSPNRQALFAWRELERLHRLMKSEPPAQAREIALKAKYSPYTASREELAQLEEARRAALGEMEKRPWYLKFLDRYVFAVC